MSNHQKSGNSFGSYILLIFGFLCLIAPKVHAPDILWGPSTLLWLIIFFYLSIYSKKRSMVRLTCLLFVIGYVIRYMGMVSGLIANIILLLPFAVAVFIIMLISRGLLAKKGSLLLSLLPPALWILLYYGTTLIRVPGAARIDFYFFDMKTLIQSEALVGSFGMNFIIVWSSVLFALALGKKKMRHAMIGLTIYVLLFAFGLVRLMSAPETDMIKVAYATGPYMGDFVNFWDVDPEETLASISKSAETAADLGASILAMNEETATVDDVDVDAFIDGLKTIAMKNRIHLLVGMDIPDTDMSDEGKNYNRIVWISPEGQVLTEYNKYNIIPLIESDYVMGDGNLKSFSINIGKRSVNVAAAICYDSNFSLYLSTMDPDVDILFLPSWDWDGITDIHYHMCGTAAVEQGVTMLKPTYDGYTIASDPYGKVLTLTHTKDTGFESVQIVELPVERTR